jgi:hypothetical protein
MKKIETTLGKLRGVLAPLLEELRSSDLARRPFVIVEEPLSRRCVHFARIVKSGPGLPPSGEMVVFDDALYGKIRLVWFDNDPRRGARLADGLLCKWLPDEAELVVTLDGNEAN